MHAAICALYLLAHFDTSFAQQPFFDGPPQSGEQIRQVSGYGAPVPQTYQALVPSYTQPTYVQVSVVVQI
jgi:hypothetical protein